MVFFITLSFQLLFLHISSPYFLLYLNCFFTLRLNSTFWTFSISCSWNIPSRSFLDHTCYSLFFSYLWALHFLLLVWCHLKPRRGFSNRENVHNILVNYSKRCTSKIQLHSRTQPHYWHKICIKFAQNLHNTLHPKSARWRGHSKRTNWARHSLSAHCFGRDALVWHEWLWSTKH